MAYTRIHPIKSTLQKALDYIENPEKTDHQMLVSGFNVDPLSASAEFRMTSAMARGIKGDYTANGGAENLAHHMIQSFSPYDKITPEEAHELGKAWADEILQGKYEYVISTHVDKGHIHNHIIFNSVSFYDYKKFDNYKVAKRLREVSDRLCQERGLYVIQNPNLSQRSLSHTEWQHRKNGISWKMQIKEAIDRAIASSSDYDSFKTALEQNGIEVLEGKRITFHKIGVESRNGRAAKCRGDRIGEDYTKARILERLAAPKQEKNAELSAAAPASKGAGKELEKQPTVWQLRREKIAATKGLAEALLMLRTENVQYVEDIPDRIQALTEQAAQTKERIHTLREKSQQYKFAAKCLIAFRDYSPLKIEYESLPAGRKRNSFAARYAEELQAYDLAGRRLEEMKVNTNVDPDKVIALVKEQDVMISRMSGELKNISERIAQLRNAQQLLTDLKAQRNTEKNYHPEDPGR